MIVSPIANRTRVATMATPSAIVAAAKHNDNATSVA